MSPWEASCSAESPIETILKRTLRGLSYEAPKGEAPNQMALYPEGQPMQKQADVVWLHEESSVGGLHPVALRNPPHLSRKGGARFRIADMLDYGIRETDVERVISKRNGQAAGDNRVKSCVNRFRRLQVDHPNHRLALDEVPHECGAAHIEDRRAVIDPHQAGL